MELEPYWVSWTSVAISATGELIRDTSDRRLLAALLSVFDDVDQRAEYRRQAYAALLRGAGKDWKDVPGVSSERWKDSPDLELLGQLRKRAGDTLEGPTPKA